MNLWKTRDEFAGSISLPYGVKTSHTWHEIGQILRVINDLDIQTFVELGVHVGGLASILLPISQYRDFVYFGVERDDSIIHPAVRGRVFISDIFSAMDSVRRVKMSRKTFVYCDGGNKIEEMKEYHKILDSGDVIACHDYYDGQDVIGLDGFGRDDGKCGCRPEVSYNDLQFLDRGQWRILEPYILSGTRIVGFIKK